MIRLSMDNTHITQIILDQAKKAKLASFKQRSISTTQKNHALKEIADSLFKNSNKIIDANRLDMDALMIDNPTVSNVIKNRLLLTPEKINAIAKGVMDIINLPDPIGEVVKMTVRPNGLRIGKIRIPIGVICCIYESRPNVTVDIAALALKSGNACILRGGKESLHTNIVLSNLIKEAVQSAGISPDFLQMVSVTDHVAVAELAKLDKYIDLMIPRGGEKLIDAVCAHARMPVLSHRQGITHIYVSKNADLTMAKKIVCNAKVSNPSTCNSLEKVLVDESIAHIILPDLIKELRDVGVEVRGCEKTQAIIPDVIPATDTDWVTEYLDLKITIKVVNDLSEAIDHINTFGTHLADGIITEDYNESWKFINSVDSAATYVNASTRFTDGNEFGLGAEIGINTSKIHGMGPMGLEELTVTKYIVFGQGQIR